MDTLPKTFHNHLLKTFQDHSSEWLNIIQNDYIDPLIKMGFEFQGYGHQYNENISGIHTLIFESDNPKIKNTSEIEKLMVQDDNQPKPSFTYYFGTLWVHIPYTA